MKKEIFRIIDANLNRSREGLRVCEDIARFVLNSPALTKALKGIRHKISDIAKNPIFSSKAFSCSRNAREDVGKCSGLASEMKRVGIKDIFCANIERVKESIRVLEEFSKIIDKSSAAKLSALRFKVYGIEKKAVERIESLRNRR